MTMPDHNTDYPYPPESEPTEDEIREAKAKVLRDMSVDHIIDGVLNHAGFEFLLSDIVDDIAADRELLTPDYSAKGLRIYKIVQQACDKYYDMHGD